MVFKSSGIGKKIECEIKKIEAVAELLPGVVIIHDLRDWRIAYISPRAEKQLGVPASELKSLSMEEYHQTYFNAEDAKDYAPKILGLIERNNDGEIVTYFQQVRISSNAHFTWHMSSTRVLLREDSGKPLLAITMSFPIDAMHHMSVKAERLLQENNLLRENLDVFAKLGKREKSVLKLIALGKSSAEVAEELFLSVATVDTHRRNIKKKLNISTVFEFGQYARAFNLI